ncbi:hypothetical protein C2U68_13825 [Methylomonas koyamae]|nr:hypothetical protein C2U68_13825 [Methylomonas koyamae]
MLLLAWVTPEMTMPMNTPLTKASPRVGGAIRLALRPPVPDFLRGSCCSWAVMLWSLITVSVLATGISLRHAVDAKVAGYDLAQA